MTELVMETAGRMREARLTIKSMYVLVMALAYVHEVDMLSLDVPQRPAFRRLTPSPKPPFTATWNVQNYSVCLDQFGVDLDLEKYNIAANKRDENDVIMIFDHAGIGTYPYIVNGDKFVNGGLPQLVNMTSHLEKATDDIIRAIPDANFSGLAVIDWEFWSPIWDENFDLERRAYKLQSIAIVQRRHPDWDPATVETVAKLEFEATAKFLFEATVKLGRLLRPHGLWGFYHYPYCRNSVHDVGHCNATSMGHNDQLVWLFDDTLAIYPSIYLKDEVVGINGSTPYVDATLKEAFRIREKSNNPLMPMHSYCRFNYSHTKYYYTLEDLVNTVLVSAEKGLDGVIFWGDHNDTRDKTACVQLKAYIKSALGPLVREITQSASCCASSLCNDHGRCIGKILECCERKTMVAPYRGPSDMMNISSVDKCQCVCYAGWSGANCNKQINEPTRPSAV